MTRRSKRLIVAAALCFAGLCIIVAAACGHAHAMLHYVRGGIKTEGPEHLSWGARAKVLFTGVTVPRPEPEGEPAAGFVPLEIQAPDGPRLGASYGKGPSPECPLVILFHGYGSEKLSLLDQAKEFRSLGMAVLLVDFRGSGDSSECYTTLGYLEGIDVAAAIGYARNAYPAAPIVLYGQSMGAAAILCAIHEHGAAPDAVIAASVYDSLVQTVRNRFHLIGIPAFPAAELLVLCGSIEMGFNGFGLNPANYARDVRCPILFLHGSADRRALIQGARNVFDAVPGMKYFHEFPNLSHQSFLKAAPQEWKKTVTEFLNQAGIPISRKAEQT